MPAPLRIALATRCLHLPVREAIRQAAESGATGVQFDIRDELKAGDLSESGRRQFLQLLRERGLSVASAHFPTRRTYFDQEQLDARIAATRAAMDFAYSLGANVLTVRLGKIPTEKDSANYKLLHEVASDLARYGNQVGVTLAVTPMQDSAAALHEFVDSVKTGPIGIDFDPAGFVISGQKAEAAFRLLYRLVVHLQARDAIRDVDGGGVEVALGRGEVDWIELLPLLDEISYPGWVTLIRTQGNDKPGDLFRGVQFLKNALLQ